MVISLPKLLKIEPNSTPTAPAPMTTIDLGICGKAQNFDVGQDAACVRFYPGQHAGVGASREHHILGLDRLLLPVRGIDRNGVNPILRRAGQAGRSPR